jgi:hypothetical protein
MAAKLRALHRHTHLPRNQDTPTAHRPWFKTQTACLVATELLQLLGIRSFRAAALLLTGLLVYDVRGRESSRR